MQTPTSKPWKKVLSPIEATLNGVVGAASFTVDPAEFELLTTLDLEVAAKQIVVADLDSNGRSDFVVFGPTGVGTQQGVQIGRLGLQAQPTLPGQTKPFNKPFPLNLNQTSQSTLSVATSDFNGDGFDDLSVSTGNFPNASTSLTRFLNDQSGLFQGVADSLPLSGRLVRDFTGDGFADILSLSESSRFNPLRSVSILPGNGDGRFSFGSFDSVRGIFVSEAFAIGTFVSGPLPDLVFSTNRGLRRVLNRELTSFPPLLNARLSSELETAGPGPVISMDWDGDGKSDVLVVDSRKLKVYKNLIPSGARLEI